MNKEQMTIEMTDIIDDFARDYKSLSPSSDAWDRYRELTAKAIVKLEDLFTEQLASVKREAFKKGVEEGRSTQAIIEIQARERFLNELRAEQEAKETAGCTCTKVCDCENPPPDDWDGESGTWHISMECPIHNTNPRPNIECPIHGHLRSR